MPDLSKRESGVGSKPDFSKMNEAQRRAVTHGEGPLLLLAGPGSGKTFTITNRILYLLRQGVSPEKILVLTFTKEAALSMQNRFENACGKMSYSVNFGTFHSVFYYILRESNVIGSTKLLTDSEKKNLFIPVLNEYEEGRGAEKYIADDAMQILSAFGYYKNTMKLTESVNMLPVLWQPYFENLYAQYNARVRELGRVDFDDMLFLCRKLLEENALLRKSWQERFEHILIDEFQDMNPIQYEIIRLLTKAPYNIFAVGDDDQSIYGFRGAEPECMQKFLSDFNAPKQLLDVNYRSCPEIVNAALAVIGENKKRFVKCLSSAGGKSPGDGTMQLHAFADKTGQFEYLIRRLREESAEGEECAVLFRTNRHMQSFAVALSKAEIPYGMKEKCSNIYEHFIVRDIMSYLQLACGSGDREMFLEVMNKPTRYVRREMVNDDSGTEIARIIENYRQASLPEWEKLKAKDALLAFEKQLNTLGRLSLYPAVCYILKAVGYEKYLEELAGGRAEKIAEWMEIVEWLKEEAKQHRDLREWLEFREKFRGDEKRGKEKIMLLTVHAAKGLEFDRVWIPDCNERVFPYGRMPDEHTIEEERRIFYVAMTRAKKSLELLYLTGTKERPRQPSAFLNPLYSSTNSSNSQLSRYSSNASATLSYSASSAM